MARTMPGTERYFEVECIRRREPGESCRIDRRSGRPDPAGTRCCTVDASCLPGSCEQSADLKRIHIRQAGNSSSPPENKHRSVLQAAPGSPARIVLRRRWTLAGSLDPHSRYMAKERLFLAKQSCR